MGTLIAVGAAVWFFVSAIGYFKMFKKAGQRGWAALLFFLPVITTLILGFGSAEYLGNPEAQKAAEEIAPIEG